MITQLVDNWGFKMALYRPVSRQEVKSPADALVELASRPEIVQRIADKLAAAKPLSAQERQIWRISGNLQHLQELVAEEEQAKTERDLAQFPGSRKRLKHARHWRFEKPDAFGPPAPSNFDILQNE